MPNKPNRGKSPKRPKPRVDEFESGNDEIPDFDESENISADGKASQGGMLDLTSLKEM